MVDRFFDGIYLTIDVPNAGNMWYNYPEKIISEVIMGKVYVVTSGKGGVGKTTTTANIGTALAMKGYKVALIDADIGLRNLDLIMGLENRVVYDLVNVVEKKCRLEQALIKDKRQKELYMLPAAQTRDKDCVGGEQMKELCENLKKDFDYILIDCPAGIEQGFKNAIAGADEALVVTTPEVSTVRDADRIIGLLEANGLKKPRLIVNRIRVDMVKHGNMMSVEDIEDLLAVEIMGIVPDDENIIITSNRGEPAAMNDKTLIGEAYRNIAGRILGQEVPFVKLDTESFFDRLKKMLGGKKYA